MMVEQVSSICVGSIALFPGIIHADTPMCVTAAESRTAATLIANIAVNRSNLCLQVTTSRTAAICFAL